MPTKENKKHAPLRHIAKKGEELREHAKVVEKHVKAHTVNPPPSDTKTHKRKSK